MKRTVASLLFALAVGALSWVTPAAAQSPATVKICIQVSTTSCVPVTASAPLPVTGSFSATLAGFTPNGNYTTLTATASTSASTSLPGGTVVAFQNLSGIDVSCVLTAGASTATTNKLIVRAGATVYYTVGSNTTTACINQTGSASNVIGLAGGDGLGTAFGGASAGGGGGGGAVTMVSGAVAAGAYSAGSIAAGAFVSGSILSGALASGAVVDLTNLSTPIAPNTATATKGILLGGQFDTTQKTLTNGQQGAVSLSPRGAVYVAAGAEALVVGGAGTAGSASGGVLTIQGAASMTPVQVSQATAANLNATVIGTGSAGTAATGVVTVQGISSMTPLLVTLSGTNNIATVSTVTSLSQFAGNAINLGAGTVGTGTLRITQASDSPEIAMLGTTADASCGTATGTCTLASLFKFLNTAATSSTPAGTNLIGDVNVRQGGTALSATNGIFSNLLQGNAVLSATNGLFSNMLLGNVAVSTSNALPTLGAINVTPTDCSGTVTTGGTAQNAFTAGATKRGFTLLNFDTSEPMWVSFTTTAAANTIASYPVPAATASTFAGAGSFTTPPGFGMNTALSVVAATTGHKWSCTWW